MFELVHWARLIDRCVVEVYFIIPAHVCETVLVSGLTPVVFEFIETKI